MEVVTELALDSFILFTGPPTPEDPMTRATSTPSLSGLWVKDKEVVEGEKEVVEEEGIEGLRR